MVAPPNAATVVSVADRMNPLGGPSSPLETRALFAAFSPSLMPRAGWHQGLAAGASLLAAESVGQLVNTSIDRVVRPESPLAARLLARGVVFGLGRYVGQLSGERGRAHQQGLVALGGRARPRQPRSAG